MSTVITINSKTGTIAVKRLREQKLKNGLPFMINDRALATNQCYMEYPGGNIKLVRIRHSTNEIMVERELSSGEANHLRKRLHFSDVK